MSTEQKISLDKALEAYRSKSAPSSLSWKQHYVTEEFSSDNALELSKEEKIRYVNRLKESYVTIFDRVSMRDGGKVSTLLDVLKLLIDSKNKNVQKTRRKVVYSTSDGTRPIGKEAFTKWNGLQVIDMDIKNAQIAKKLKVELFEHLKRYNWFVGVTLSSSGAGLHIYTKIQLSETDNANERTKKIIYLTNFRQKFSFVYLICKNAADRLGFAREDLVRWMDLSMFKPQQGAFIGYDPEAMFSTHFFEEFMYVGFDIMDDFGDPNLDWVTYPELTDIFKRWAWFEDDEDTPQNTISVKDSDNIDFDKNRPQHYKHAERWRIANTLCAIYGQQQGYTYLRKVCSGVPSKELQGDCITASRHNKPIDIWAVNRLNSMHGFNIKLDVKNSADNDVNCITETINNIESPLLLKEATTTKNFFIKATQYLSDIKTELLNNLGRITLIEAGAGVGKTEMVKSLCSDGNRIMLVMPFTSTIKSKIENELGGDWTSFYGNKKVNLNNTNSIALTIDKFSKLNMIELVEAHFDYIFIDESHLLFQSEYRDVMPHVIDMINHTQVPIILMSGTPIGETVFFDDLVHLKITKEETRKKEFHIILTNKPEDNFNHMINHMAQDIIKGTRVLFPSNKGTQFKEKIESQLSALLKSKYGYTKKISVNYYKKSNVGETFIDEINKHKTIKKTNVLMCSNYLSVGVDITDKYDFNVYFDECWMPQEIEQFANRLRARDLFIYMFINKLDADGNARGINIIKPLNMLYSDEEKRFYVSVINLCNGMITRNPTEYKSNTLISGLLAQCKFIKRDEMENKYFIDDTAYKTIYFERKYREYIEQLQVLVKGMIEYGYEYSCEDLGQYTTNEAELMLMKSEKSNSISRYKTQQTLYAEEIMNMITADKIQLYRDVVAGRYEIIKSNDWKEDIENKIIYVKDAETFDKIVPTFVQMSKLYDPEDIKEIFYFCKNKNGTFNFAALRRMKILINMVYNSKNNRLDLPIQRFMEYTYKFIEKSNECKTAEVDKFIYNFAQRYMDAESKDPRCKIALSELLSKQVIDNFTELFNCLVTKQKSSKKGYVKLKKVELMWVTKEEKETEFYKNDKIYVFSDFLENVKINKTVIKDEQN